MLSAVLPPSDRIDLHHCRRPIRPLVVSQSHRGTPPRGHRHRLLPVSPAAAPLFLSSSCGIHWPSFFVAGLTSHQGLVLLPQLPRKPPAPPPISILSSASRAGLVVPYLAHDSDAPLGSLIPAPRCSKLIHAKFLGLGLIDPLVPAGRSCYISRQPPTRACLPAHLVLYFRLRNQFWLFDFALLPSLGNGLSRVGHRRRHLSRQSICLGQPCHAKSGPVEVYGWEEGTKS